MVTAEDCDCEKCLKEMDFYKVHYPENVKEMQDELEKRFTYHAPKEGQPERYNKLRAQGELMARIILDMTPRSREQSLALTNLEQAIMWANAAIARNE